MDFLKIKKQLGIDLFAMNKWGTRIRIVRPIGENETLEDAISKTIGELKYRYVEGFEYEIQGIKTINMKGCEL